MLFITNRALRQSRRSRRGRPISFHLDDNEAQQSVFFCRRGGAGDYTELTSGPFLDALRESEAEQILVFIHGFSNLPETGIFPRAQALQDLFDAKQRSLVEVVPLIWPCDNDRGILKDYWDDQQAADASAFAFARVLEKFLEWRDGREAAGAAPCLKRISVLAHSMGNRVFRETVRVWTRYYLRQAPPLLFRNSFLVAADVVNETLARGESGAHLAAASRNVVVYYASDDLALRASKVSNLKNRVASRRLGHTGPEDVSRVAANIHAVNCDEVNTRYDPPKGHSYFTYDEDADGALYMEEGGRPGLVFDHLYDCIRIGRVRNAVPRDRDTALS